MLPTSINKNGYLYAKITKKRLNQIIPFNVGRSLG